MIKKWFLALRPWSFTAATIPIGLGTVVAAFHGSFDLLLFFMVLISGILIQAGTNLANTYGDYISGVDTSASTTTCRELVDKILIPSHMRNAAVITLTIVALIGIYFIYLRGVLIFVIGSIGIIGGYTYTLGPSPYKYKGLGSIFVFFLMGPLMSFGAYYVQTGLFHWTPILASLPIAFLVSAILHSNDLRDVYHDRKAGIKTLAIILGKNKSFRLYLLLNIAAFLAIIFLTIAGVLPIIGLLPLVLVPKLIKIIMNTQASWQGDSQKLNVLELYAAQFHFQFGLIFIAGLLFKLILF